MKKIISILLTTIMLCCGSFAVHAQEVDSAPVMTVQPRYTGMFSYYADLSSSGNTLIATSGITPYEGFTCTVTFELQRKRSGGSWSHVATYTDTGDSSHICSIYETATAASGYSYRGYCTFQAFDKNGKEVDLSHNYTAILYF